MGGRGRTCAIRLSRMTAFIGEAVINSLQYCSDDNEQHDVLITISLAIKMQHHTLKLLYYPLILQIYSGNMQFLNSFLLFSGNL